MRPDAHAPARCVWDVQAELGEGAVWIARERAVYFVDILGRAIHRWQADGERRSWPTPAEPGFLFAMAGGGLICGLRGGLHRFDPACGSFELLARVEADQRRHRLNDGFVDHEGRLWFGTMHEDTQTRGGRLYTFDRHGALRVHDGDYIVTNGPAISPDGTTIYHSDSALRTVYAFDLCEGRLSNKRPFTILPEGQYPDGMVSDADACLWIAVFNGARLARYSPRGAQVDEIRLPCAQVTKPAFGDDDLRTLYITTARTGLTPLERANQPLAGALYAVRLPVAGQLTHEFGALPRKQFVQPATSSTEP